MLDGTLFFVKSAKYRNRGKDVFPGFVLYMYARTYARTRTYIISIQNELYPFKPT